MVSAVVDLPGLLKGIPLGSWVAISEEQHKVLAYGRDVLVVFDRAKAAGEGLPLIVRVPEQPLRMFL